MIENEIIQWGCEYLTSHGYTLISNLPEDIKNTPWSFVVRFETSEGYIYLKQTPELFALEPTIIQILHDQFNASVPVVIAHNNELNCFLMRDAGQSLREILKKKFDAALLCRAIEQFTSLQIAVSDHIDVLLDIGVPDYRLDKLPGLYQELISQGDLLRAEGLAEIEIKKLESLLPTVSRFCQKLAGYAIKQTIVQPDFNDNNTLVEQSSQKITIIDLGEIVISHPFFSLLNCLEQIKKHHGLTEDDEIYLKIKDACFKHYMNLFTSKEDLADAFATAQVLHLVYDISYENRFMNACGKERLISFQHWKLSNLLRAFITACNTISFKPLQENDLDLLCHWLDQPHVKEWWDDGLTHDEVRRKYRARIGDTTIVPFIVYLDDKPIGFIQYYHAEKVGDGWWPDEVAGTVGIDQFIGEANYINRGYGTQMIVAFNQMLFENNTINKIITDVDPNNKRAIRCYEKAGFKFVKVQVTPDGFATVMELKKLQSSD